MKVKKVLIAALFLCVALVVAMLPESLAMAQTEQIPDANSSFDALWEGASQVADTTATVLRQIIKVIPYAGVILFVVGIFVAIFSTRNKGRRRWGLKLAFSGAIFMYVLYVALTLVHDFACLDNPVRPTSRPAQEKFYEKAYYDAMEGIKADGQSFLFLSNDWVNGVMIAGRKMYMSIVGLLIFASISIGVLFMLVTKREKAIRRFALAGLCIASPLTLGIGYLILRL